MKALRRQIGTSIRVLLVFTIVLGLIYPLSVWLIARAPGLHANAEGSPIMANGQVVGSALIGIDPTPVDPARDPWFHNRPSASAEGALGPGDPSTSGGSNYGPHHEELIAVIKERQEHIAQREGVNPAQIPPDAVTASASGVDPTISVAYAQLQVPRVARNTGLAENVVRDLVAKYTSSNGIGVSGVNVLPLNLAIQSELPANSK